MATDKRAYHSPVRDQQKAETRAQILQAVVDVVLNDGVHAFSVQTVAKRAGVSHRTVYRHFQSREALLEGLADSLDEYLGRTGLPTVPDSMDDLPGLVGPTFERVDHVADAATVYVITSIALDTQTQSRHQRSRAFRAVMARTFPHLDPGELERSFAVVRSLISVYQWHHLRQLGLRGQEPGEAVAWAVRTLLDDLRRRDERAAPNPETDR